MKSVVRLTYLFNYLKINLLKKNKKARWPDKTAGVGWDAGGPVPNLLREALFCLDLQTHIPAQKLAFLPFFLIKQKEQ